MSLGWMCGGCIYHDRMSFCGASFNAVLPPHHVHGPCFEFAVYVSIHFFYFSETFAAMMLHAFGVS